MKLKRYEIENQVQFLSEEQIKEGIAKPAIKKWAYALHDQDTREDGSPKEPHYHVMIWLNNAYDSKYVAQWFGVQEQSIEKIKSDVGAEEYLIHANAPDKFQYSPDIVQANFDVFKEVEAEKKKIARSDRVSEIINAIDQGEIRAYNVHEHITVEEYDRYKKHIDNAFLYRQKKIKGVNRDMECVYIVGESGCGKTTYAKQIAQDRGFSTFVSSGTNDPLDDYEGQDCIILDDLRPSTMGLADLLKMLDNNTASSVKSRYRNKVLECKMIIITTTLPIESFFRQVFAEEQESAVQLQRRCKTLIKMDRERIVFSVWQDDDRRYLELAPVPNAILARFTAPERSLDDNLEFLQKTLGMTRDLIEDIRKHSKELGLEEKQIKIDGFEEDQGKIPWD